MAIHAVTITVELEDGYEPTGEFRAPRMGELFVSAYNDIVLVAKFPSVGPRVILRRVPTFPPQLSNQVAAIAKDGDGRWWMHESYPHWNSQICEWDTDDLRPCFSVDARLIDDKFSSVPAEQSLIKNPNWVGLRESAASSEIEES